MSKEVQTISRYDGSETTELEGEIIDLMLQFARKEEVPAWVNHELNGYPEGVPLPAYRMPEARVLGNIITIDGDIEENFPLPLGSLDKELQEDLGTLIFDEPLLAIARMTNIDDINAVDAKMVKKISPDHYQLFNKALGKGYQVDSAWSEIDGSRVEDIVTQIRLRLDDYLAKQNSVGGRAVAD